MWTPTSRGQWSPYVDSSEWPLTSNAGVRNGSKASRGSSEAEQRRAAAHVQPGHQKGRSASFCASTPIDNERRAGRAALAGGPTAGSNIPSAGRGVRRVFHYLWQQFFTYLAQFSLSVASDNTCSSTHKLRFYTRPDKSLRAVGSIP